MLTNMLKLDSEVPLPWVIVIITCICVIVTWSIAATGAFIRSTKTVKSALIMWTVFIILWIFLFIWSCFPSGLKNACIENHCPEAMWLVENPWQKILLYHDYSPESNDAVAISSTKLSIPSSNVETSAFNVLSDRKSDDVNPNKDKELKSLESYNNDIDINNCTCCHEKTDMKYRIQTKKIKHRSQQSATIIVVIMFVLFFSYFLYGWIILYSYKIYLKTKKKVSISTLHDVPEDNNFVGSC
ncbi:uncharacterized protein LOC126898572 isoform X2 [Daktulosphaira vitifoliae]|uniref:uncharacterized protein LOC126898572 isoform X2 n=1 Tax=Daktulosphaira vitifoliae TaxID=58002 RepID=UPI0021A9F0AE|nr:uncharacterized protein LOC126898572 isoform X2 [Daktulosphaira vitifoliae]